MAAQAALRVGWLGAGVMGRSMAGHLLKAGYPVSIFSRTASKCQPLVDAGAELCASPAEVASKSDVVFSIVGFPADVEKVLLGEKGVIETLAPGSIVCDMTTSSPSLAKRIHEAFAARDVAALDAPVSGGDIGARNGTLSIMCGGDRGAFDKVHPLFEAMGENIKHLGGPGAGQYTKCVNQIFIATNMIGMCEGLLFAKKAGLDPMATIEAVKSGAAGSWSVSNLAPRIVRGDYQPGFFVEHFIKDLGICATESKRMGLALPGLALAEQLYIALQAQGHARCGTQALMLALEHLNNVQFASGDEEGKTTK